MTAHANGDTTRIVVPDTDEVPGFQDLVLMHKNDFAATYRARPDESGDDQYVAVKVLGIGFADAPTRKALNRYRHATRRLCDVGNVLQPLDTGLTYAGQPYVATAYHPSGSLGDRLVTTGPLALADVLAAVVPVGLALHAAHGLGLCHKGVKPNNVLLAADGQPLLADFVTANLRADHLISLGLGTPLHTAPEVLSGQEPSARSDVYALAATVFHLLAGRPPYGDRGGVAGLLLSIISDGAPTLNRADVPDSLRVALARALAAEPQARFPDALAFAVALHEVLAELNLPAPDPPLIWPEPGPSTPAEAPATRTAAASTDLPAPDVSMPTAAEIPTPGMTRNDQPVDTALAETSITEAPNWDVDHSPSEPGSSSPATVRASRRRTRSLLGVAVAGALVVVVLAGASALAARTRVPGQASPPATSPSISAAPSVASAPTAVTAIDDGATVNLRWTLTENAMRANVVVQQQPAVAGRPGLTVLNPKMTSHPVTGLNPAIGYCFRVGVLLNLATAGQSASVAWSAPVCIRGARPATST